MSSDSTGFSNQVVAAETLPDFRNVPLNRVAPEFLPYTLITSAAFWLFLVLLSLLLPRLPFVGLDLGPWPSVGLFLAMVWFAVISWLEARRRGWAVREHDLIYRSGLIWRKTVIVPFARIQHVETASGPLERLFGLMRVKCFTAGGMMADLSVEGLNAEAAREVRQFLLEQIREDQSIEPRPAPVSEVTGESD
jgi:uncharacterized protein